MFEEGIDPLPPEILPIRFLDVNQSESFKPNVSENFLKWKYMLKTPKECVDDILGWGGGCQVPKVALICAKFDWKLPERERERERDRDRDREIKVQNSIQFSATILSYHSNQC